MIATKIKRFSQRNEQEHILASVGSEVGTFLDIGSWNACDMSNVRALFELGWAGVIVEFSPKPLEGLIREYENDPRIQIIAAAVGVERSLTKFYITEDAVSTSNDTNYEKWKGHGGFYGSAYVPVITLEDIAAEFGVFDFVSVDCEGESVEIFKRMIALGWRPRAICVEHDSLVEQCEQSAQAAGYRKVYESEENLVFAR